MNEYLDKIHIIAKELENKNPKKIITIMEVCGGHTNTIMKYAIRDILPKNINLISGPGCPVCVTSQRDIDNIVTLAEKGIPVATYGDMMDVPGSNFNSLSKAKEKGADITLIYSAQEMLKPENRNKVFFGIGFETTTPMTAYLLDKGICVYSIHKIMPPPMKAIVDQTRIDGFIDPGHVSAIIGTQFWNELKVPQVICGFKKDQIIRGIYLLLKLINENKNEVINDYPEVVKSQGNIKAQEMIKKTMKLYDADWRGLGNIPLSGLEPKNENLNARIKYHELIKDVVSKENPACRCGEILKGICGPKDCPLFGKACTPKNPMGACMVSETEGACGIAYKFLNKE